MPTVKTLCNRCTFRGTIVCPVCRKAFCSECAKDHKKEVCPICERGRFTCDESKEQHKKCKEKYIQCMNCEDFIIVSDFGDHECAVFDEDEDDV